MNHEYKLQIPEQVTSQLVTSQYEFFFFFLWISQGALVSSPDMQISWIGVIVSMQDCSLS